MRRGCNLASPLCRVHGLEILESIGMSSVVLLLPIFPQALCQWSDLVQEGVGFVESNTVGKDDREV